MSRKTKKDIKDESSFKAIIKGIMVGYIITVPVFMLFAFILSRLDFPRKYITPAVVITSIISILAAGSSASRGLRNKGWMNGALCGFLYMFVLYLLSGIVFGDYSINRYVVTMTVIGLLTGAIGGIIGINLNPPKKYFNI